jgi:hypothetical protein
MGILLVDALLRVVGFSLELPQRFGQHRLQFSTGYHQSRGPSRSTWQAIDLQVHGHLGRSGSNTEPSSNPDIASTTWQSVGFPSLCCRTGSAATNSCIWQSLFKATTNPAVDPSASDTTFRVWRRHIPTASPKIATVCSHKGYKGSKDFSRGPQRFDNRSSFLFRRVVGK